jgi:uncharacterized membrane protein
MNQISNSTGKFMATMFKSIVLHLQLIVCFVACMGSGVENINFIKCNLSSTAIFRADILLFNKHFLIHYLIEAEKIDIFLNYGTYKLNVLVQEIFPPL